MRLLKLGRSQDGSCSEGYSSWNGLLGKRFSEAQKQKIEGRILLAEAHDVAIWEMLQHHAASCSIGSAGPIATAPSPHAGMQGRQGGPEEPERPGGGPPRRQLPPPANVAPDEPTHHPATPSVRKGS